ncbi:acyl-CoA N-acyltransferase [Dendryphion nanum]|uniref:Acyl-CoA N-acyltransferase n=1 Tax=Dendryphion nanum TaxID=256645 RepID=A0A9P9DE98_9PLEO|nr:acyl-CoA N-acyltransferase [Dendryphion nanum]
MAPNRLVIAPLTEQDAHEYQAIRYTTFKPTINNIFYTREPSQETLNRVIEDTKLDIIRGVRFMTCRDTDTGTMIAGARWRYVAPKDMQENYRSGSEPEQTRPRDRTWEEVDSDCTIPPPYTESDPRCFNALFQLFNFHKRDIMGTRPYFCLDTLVTHPDHHRRGAGGLLIKWGIEEADRRNVECYLEASPMGVPLYERYGFEKVRDIELDLRPFGYEHRFDFIPMRRPARWERS